MNKRIGVFICWCGSNIAEVIDVDEGSGCDESISGGSFRGIL